MKIAVIGNVDRANAVAIETLEDTTYLPNLVENPTTTYAITRVQYDEVFYPKAKHMPKGHQRPYKFHK